MTNGSAKNDFIVKTPVLSQINAVPEDLRGLNIEAKETFHEQTSEKSVTPNNYFTSSTQDANEAPFDTLSFYDSYVSFQQPLFESESRKYCVLVEIKIFIDQNVKM